jgi:hypothetical protein
MGGYNSEGIKGGLISLFFFVYKNAKGGGKLSKECCKEKTIAMFELVST